MKKLKKLAVLMVLPALVSSCIVSSTHYTTGNPIGNKVGYMKGKNTKGDPTIAIANAAKLGGITTIGSVDIYYYYFFPITGKMAIKVSGE